MRAVLDPNVLISAIISDGGGPAEVMSRWRSGAFELIASAALLRELEAVLGYERLRRFVDRSDALEFLAVLNDEARVCPDPGRSATRSTRDPDDEYLVSLARAERAAIVSGDRHLLELAGELPVYSPREFVELLDEVLGP
ncbi:putative toxin-antitoxin system toxin component, PIN family [Thermoleophilia bacterium SCSIO 60948]|nr:putative toxin-antitoxin system toxin component, PIN family [Thermoleophilia bacterium SCSIO 60948]